MAKKEQKSKNHSGQEKQKFQKILQELEDPKNIGQGS